MPEVSSGGILCKNSTHPKSYLIMTSVKCGTRRSKFQLLRFYLISCISKTTYHKSQIGIKIC